MQALDNLAKASRLKDMLEERVAQYPVETSEEVLNKKVLDAEARAAHLDLEVRGLKAALTQAAKASQQLEGAVLPILLGFESDLIALVEKGNNAQRVS